MAPTRSAQLTFPGGGTVTALNVQPGQEVKQGDVLAEFAADDQSLQAARTQSTLAELAYEQEQQKLASMQQGAPKDTIDQAQAVIARDQAAISQIQQQQQAAQQAAQAAQAASDNAEQSKAVAKDAADRKVQLAQVALQSAQDSLVAAQDAAKEADASTQAAQSQMQSDADTAVTSAQQALVSAQRSLQSANLKLSQAKLNWAQTKAGQDLETEQFKVQQDQDAVKDAQTADDASKKGTQAEQAAADAALQNAKRALQADQLQLKHDQLNMDTSKTVDDATVQQAQIDQQNAQDAVTQAQTNLQHAQQRDQNTQQLSAAGTTGQPGATSPAAAQAAVKQAQHAVDTATINLQDAQSAADQAGLGGGPNAPNSNTNAPPAPDQSTMDAAKAQLSADQSHLASLQAGTDANQVAQEQQRVDLLHQQATQAAQATQPVMDLTAPFDGTVTDVGISAGQTIAPGAALTGQMSTAPASLAGNNTQGQPVAIRIVAAGTTSIIANASETDVSQLNPNQQVSVSFPGLQGQTVDATIAQIASTPSIQQDGTATYPVQIDLPQAPPNLKMGMSAQVGISVPGDMTLIVPRAAVQNVSGQSTVTKLDASGQTESVPVQLGRSSGNNVELLSGVQEGDTVMLPAVSMPLVAAQPPSSSKP